MKRIAILLCTLLSFVSCSEKGEAPQPSEEAPLLHDSFTLTEDDFNLMISHQREEIQAAILPQKSLFLDLVAQMLTEDPNLFLLVDKQNSLPSSYVPEDLVDLDDIGVLNKNRAGHKIRRIAFPSLLEMNQAANEAGLSLLCSSTYRSYVYQVRTYNYWVDTLGQVEADRVSAKPGKSQHQLGLVIDFGNIDNSYAETAAGQWQLENAWKYGWSLSYPEGKESLTGYSYESWHFRYIGKAASEMEQIFFFGEQQSLLLFWNDKSSYLREKLAAPTI